MVAPAPQPHWSPGPQDVADANLGWLLARAGVGNYPELHRWSVQHRTTFWEAVIARLGIAFATPAVAVATGDDPEDTRWLPGARLNIVASCFTGNDTETAVVHASGDELHRLDLGTLRSRVAATAAGLAAAGIEPGDAVAIAMPMSIDAVCAYLGVVAAGAVVVSIADSFAPEEIATRLAIAGADTIVTQDVVPRAGRTLPMYDKVVAADAARAFVVDTGGGVDLRPGDLSWADVARPGGELDPRPADPDDAINVLFSSGTTGEPKAIPWSHLTPIKAAMDGHFHQDIRPGDVVAWPTNLGWMMGPWLIFASLLNGAALALYDDVPTGPGFCSFVERAGVTMLGVVPSLVAAWRDNGATEGVDWSAVRAFSSTGEASNPEDMAWLMDRAGGKPVIEYCGGTEIGGGYITGTVVQPAVPGAFSTPALGLDLVILGDDGEEADEGEVFLVGPSIGLSSRLLNRDHHDVYFAGTPRPGLRRHGDHMARLDGGYYRALGRVDDTMNLGGIKVSSAEIERVVSSVPGVAEAAAVAVAPAGGGPAQLVVYAVPEAGHEPDAEAWRADMQGATRDHLNPLFRIHRVVPIAELPRTASAKVMRRELRARLQGVS